MSAISYTNMFSQQKGETTQKNRANRHALGDSVHMRMGTEDPYGFHGAAKMVREEKTRNDAKALEKKNKPVRL